MLTKETIRQGECVQCGECCKKMRITSVLSNLVRQHGSLKEAEIYYGYRGIRIAAASEKQDRVLLEMDIPCSQLTPENTCLVHDQPDKMPLICRKYPWFEDDIESCGFYFVEKKGII